MIKPNNLKIGPNSLLYPGKEDKWLLLERGIGAFYYVMFQRTVVALTVM